MCQRCTGKAPDDLELGVLEVGTWKYGTLEDNELTSDLFE